MLHPDADITDVEFVIAETMDTVLDTALRREKSEGVKPATILPESVVPASETATRQGELC